MQVSSNAQVLHLVIYFLPIECLRSFKPANFLRYPFRFECYPGMSCSGMQSSPVCGSCLNSEAIVLFADGSFSDPKRSVLLWHILQARSQKAPRLTLNLNLTSLKRSYILSVCTARRALNTLRCIQRYQDFSLISFLRADASAEVPVFSSLPSTVKGKSNVDFGQ